MQAENRLQMLKIAKRVQYTITAVHYSRNTCSMVVLEAVMTPLGGWSACVLAGSRCNSSTLATIVFSQ